MKIDILTLFPDMFNYLNQSIIGKANDKGLIDVKITDFRNYTNDKHNQVDDTSFGGGAGMLLKPEPIFRAMDQINADNPDSKKRVILLDPAGKRFDQAMAKQFAQAEHLVFICGHYEGYDERIKTLVTDEVSMGDFVITGGELGAMTIVDATSRLIPGVLGNRQSYEDDSFYEGLLEYPQYTKPQEYRGLVVPEVLTSGHHENIKKWREEQALIKTAERRPDLLSTAKLSEYQKEVLKKIKKNPL